MLSSEGVGSLMPSVSFSVPCKEGKHLHKISKKAANNFYPNNTRDVYLYIYSILIIAVMFIYIFIRCPLTWDR